MATFPKKTDKESPVAEAKAETTLSLTQSELDAKIAEAVAKATKSPSDDIKDAVAAALREVIPATAIALQQAQATNGAVNNIALAKARSAKTDRCSICGQVLAACGGPWATKATIEAAKHLTEQRRADLLAKKFNEQGFVVDDNNQRVAVPDINHVKMVVYPVDATNERWFTGVRINGRHYMSNGPQHGIWVPRENNIASTLHDFEEGERRARTPRTSMRNSGSVSANGGMNYNPASFND